MTKDLKLGLVLALAALIAVELLAAFGVGRSVLGDLRMLIHRPDVAILVGGSILGAAAVLYAMAWPRAADLLAICLGGAAIALLLYVVVPVIDPSVPRSQQIMSIVGTGVGLASVVCMAWRARSGHHRGLARHLLIATAFLAALCFSIGPALMVGATIQPATLDFVAYRIDATLGFNPSVVLAVWAAAVPWFKTLLEAAYALVLLVFPVLYGLQLRSGVAPPVSYLKVWSVGVLLGYFTYFLFPITGPLYAFGEKTFPLYMPALEQIAPHPAVVPFAPRNGMPSMHFGWALLFWINASLLPMPRAAKLLRPLAAIFVGLTGLATLALGEHYLVDLVVAVPFVIGVQALCTSVLPWNNKARRNGVLWGFAIAYAWIVAMLVGGQWFISIPGMTWLAIIATLVAAPLLYLPLARASAAAAAQRPPLLLADAAVRAEQPTAAAREVRYATSMFVLSGFAGIVYEVLFSKALALTFGSTATASYTVLSTYMGGMAIGAWIGGRMAARHPQPLVLYAFCEFAIALYCAMTPLVFKGIKAGYVGLAAGLPPDAPVLTVMRVALGVGCLLAPTILMGMTLPVLARFFQDRASSMGKSVAMLYGANTFGAALGALLAGYFVLPALGVQRTTLAAAVINLVVAVLAIELHKRVLKSETSSRDAVTEPIAPAASAPRGRDGDLQWLAKLAVLTLAVGGAVTLAIEVKYMHLLAVVAGNSTYAFSLMLFTFLAGLGLGAEMARRFLLRSWPLPLLLGWLEFALAAVILAGVFLWSRMPDYFASFQLYPTLHGFAAREVVRGIVCWLAMFPPAVFIGAIYPVAMECIGRARPHAPIQALGLAAALNTLGNIAGVLVGAFLLLPYLGALRSVQLLAVVCAALGTFALWRVPGSGPLRWVPAAAAAALLAIQPATLDYDRLSSGANVYFAAQDWGKVIDHAESIDGGLTSVSVRTQADSSTVRTLLTNGKFQGNDSQGGEMQAQIGFAFAPLLHTAHRERALVIGYGTGVSARTLCEAGFTQLDVVDITADIIRLANQHFASVNDRVTAKPGVNTYITDGRNFLMLQDRQYDVIGIEITSIWFAGAASLYNKEFYQLVKSRLQVDGVLQQWVQLHHIGHEDVLRILGSVRSEFRYVWLYLIGGQGIIIATNSSNAFPREENAEMIKRTASLKPLLEILHADPANVVRRPLLDPQGTDRLLSAFGVPASVWVSTDDNLFLEYSTPKGNASEGTATFESNTNFIAQHSTGPITAQTSTRNVAENQ
jgi:predicted membrane-bound spermidine synthase